MKITPIDIIKDMSGKVCSHSDTHISLNHSSGKMFTSKLCHPYEGEASTAQLAQQQAFKTRAAYATAWLNANKPSTTNGESGTEAYQEAMQIKKQLQLSNIRQVVCKYMNESGVVTLPSGATGNSGNSDNAGNATTYSISLSALPAAGGSVGSGQATATAGSTVRITASANSGYTVTKWSDDNTNATRDIVVNSDITLQAIFTADSADDDDENAGGGSGSGENEGDGDGDL